MYCFQIAAAIALVVLCFLVVLPLALILGRQGNNSYKRQSALIAPPNETRAWLNASSAGDSSAELIALICGSKLLSLWNTTEGELDTRVDLPLGGDFVLPSQTASRIIRGNITPLFCPHATCARAISNLTSILILRSEPSDKSMTWALYISMELFDPSSISPPSSKFESDFPILISKALDRVLSRPARLHLFIASKPIPLTRGQNATIVVPRGLTLWADRSPLSSELSQYIDNSDIESIFCTLPQKLSSDPAISSSSSSSFQSQCEVFASFYPPSSSSSLSFHLTITQLDDLHTHPKPTVSGLLNATLPLDPPLPVVLRGELNLAKKTFTLSTEISWNFPMGIKWFNLSRVKLDFQMNSTAKFLEIFADARIQIPTASSAVSAIRFYAHTTFQSDLVMVLDSIPYEAMSGSSILHLAAPNENRSWTDLVKLDSAPESLQYAFVLSESPLAVRERESEQG